MDEDDISMPTDMALGYLKKQDLYSLSVDDLNDRIEALKTEILRCEAALKDRSSTRSAAEELFKS